MATHASASLLYFSTFLFFLLGGRGGARHRRNQQPFDSAKDFP
jgi:hypothetical protein